MAAKIRNRKLHDKMKVLVEKALNIMQPDLRQAWDIRTEILHTNKPFLATLLSESKPNFQYLINRYKDYDIEKLPEFKEVEDLLKKDATISKYIHGYIGSQRGADRQFTWSSRYIYHIIEQLVKKHFYDQDNANRTCDDPAFNSKLFESLYLDFERMCYKGSIPVRDLAPLHNFDVSDRRKNMNMTELIQNTPQIMEKGYDSLFEVEPIELEKNLRIKQITHKEFKTLFNLQDSEHLSMFEVGEPRFAIECDVNEPVVTYRQHTIVDNKYQSEDSIDAVLTALRLFRSDFVGYSNIFPFKEIEVFVEFKHKPKHIVKDDPSRKLYSVTKNDLINFRSFWKKHGHVLLDSFGGIGKWKELGNAITNYSSSFDRTTDKDKIIDLFIGVEQLFNIKGVNNTRKIVSERLARLIGKDELVQDAISRDMKILADERGKAAHSPRRAKYNYERLEGYLRRAINEYLKRINNDPKTTHEKIVDSTPISPVYHYPAIAVDIIAEKDGKLLLIRRLGKTFQYSLALPGGFIENREKVEDAAVREMKEETNVDVEIIDILGVYSAPYRDPRGHVVTVVFIAEIIGGKPKSGDDAQGIRWIEYEDTLRTRMSSDHPRILEDYQKWKKEKGTFWSGKISCQ